MQKPEPHAADLVLSAETVRRLFIVKQQLAGPPVHTDASALLSLIHDLGCLQLDPTNVVARSHLLVLWSRVGFYDPATVDDLLWRRKDLFEYWAHAASIVGTGDYPIHEATLMRSYPGTSAWGNRVRDWMKANARLRKRIMETLRAEGPLPASAIEDVSEVAWESGGWTSGRNVERMLTFLWTKGEVCVGGRTKRGRLWTTASNHLPLDKLRKGKMKVDEAVPLAIERSVRALGAAPKKDILTHFIRNRYRNIDRHIRRLRAEGRLVAVEVRNGPRTLREAWYLHADDIALVRRITDGEWEPRTTLLSPFDNLICNRERTSRLFGFHFRLEIYVPKEKRRFGYFVMPVLHGDRLIGRVDPRFDRRSGVLTINALHHEQGTTAKERRAAVGAVEDLAQFLGARSIEGL